MMSLGPFPRFAGPTIKNIEASWALVVSAFSLEEAGNLFFTTLFEEAPSVEHLFTRSKRVQGEMVMSLIDSAIRLLKDLKSLVPVLIDLGLRHRAYQVKVEHFPVVGEALLATLDKALGSSFTPKMRQSWVVVYNLISSIMMSVLDPPPRGTAASTPQEQRDRIVSSNLYPTSETASQQGCAGTGGKKSGLNIGVDSSHRSNHSHGSCPGGGRRSPSSSGRWGAAVAATGAPGQQLSGLGSGRGRSMTGPSGLFTTGGGGKPKRSTSSFKTRLSKFVGGGGGKGRGLQNMPLPQQRDLVQHPAESV
ncbi:unnamed protein product [Discosporangium mesarthrocarpum]